LALVPILIWNAQNNWVSILYQIRDRHQGGGVNWIRYFRFWGIQVLIAGPALFGFLFFCFRNLPKVLSDRKFLFLGLWTLPPFLIYFTQPLFSDFKPHWVLVVWIPLAFAFIYALQRDLLNSTWQKALRFQVGLGAFLIGFFWLSCHFPVQSWVISKAKGGNWDPRLDVTNDLYGWPNLSHVIESKLGQYGLGLPVVGGRYQTAAQASFSLRDFSKVTQSPLNFRELHEWPNLDLNGSFVYVTCNRYTAEPHFPTHQCKDLGPTTFLRQGLLAKEIRVWLCEPN
jgi:hypothetical protein